MNTEIKDLKEKASELYIQYVSLSGCDGEELDITYNNATELIENSVKNKEDYSEEDLLQLAESYKKLSYIKNHEITGAITINGIKTKYSNRDGLITVQLMKE